MALVQVRVELDRNIRKKLRQIVTEPMRLRAEQVLAEAKETAPVESGTWAESLEIEPHEREGAWRVGSPDPRSVHIEYGTRFTPEHATLRKALDAAKRG